eukprot:364185-Chlamydomonas_euryale.AAC.6
MLGLANSCVRVRTAGPHIHTVIVAVPVMLALPERHFHVFCRQFTIIATSTNKQSWTWIYSSPLLPAAHEDGLRNIIHHDMVLRSPRRAQDHVIRQTCRGLLSSKRSNFNTLPPGLPVQGMFHCRCSNLWRPRREFEIYNRWSCAKAAQAVARLASQILLLRECKVVKTLCNVVSSCVCVCHPQRTTGTTFLVPQNSGSSPEMAFVELNKPGLIPHTHFRDKTRSNLRGSLPLKGSFAGDL